MLQNTIIKRFCVCFSVEQVVFSPAKIHIKSHKSAFKQNYLEMFYRAMYFLPALESGCHLPREPNNLSNRHK